MCSRYSLTSPPEAVRTLFRTVNDFVDFPPRYNIAPTQPVPVIRLSPKGERELVLVRWGLIPAWVKNPADYSTLINARSETAAEKPSFLGPLRHRRCLVPTNGFYEWIGRPGSKRPYLIAPAHGGDTLMAMAGLFDHWVGADGSEIETMAILTTAANTTVAAIHDRMPVIVKPSDFDLWLDCRPGSARPVEELLQAAPDDLLGLTELDPRINNVRAEGRDVQRALTTDVGTKLI
jgi:putative SOS response-associated peptidase YedK